MADFDVLEIQKQVRLLVGHDGLDTKVITWTNRVIQAIATRAFWGAQIVQQLGTAAANQTAFTSNFLTANLTTADVINIYRVEQAKMSNATVVSTYVNQLQRVSPESLAVNYIARTPAGQSADTMDQYALMAWATSGNATTQYQYPQIAVYPGPSNATTTTGGVGGLLFHYLQAPAALTTGTGTTGTNWIIQKYFDTVVAGVLRYARLYIGDAQGYLIEKAEYENGIATMRKNEETYYAQTPVMRGVVSEDAGGM